MQMPMDRSRYPDNWEAISHRIRFERAGGRCEWCDAVHGEPHPVTGSQVVLTTAHLDHDPSNCDDDNLVALCQRCHLGYDAQEHARHAAVTRRRQMVEAGQMEMRL
jgi:hypothetical protein